jgi:peptidyl-prolyl cis-trans isomerase C
MLNSCRVPLALALAGLLLASPLAVLAQDPANPVLIENSVIQIRKSDYLLELERLPANIRPGFANNERRVHDLLRRMLVDRTLAAQAREEKLDQVPENAAKLAAEVDRLMTLLKVLKVEAGAAADFDARKVQWEARAKEIYTVDRKKYATPEQFDASHILIKTDNRSSDEALRLARDARAKALAAPDFNQLARQISEDGSAKRNLGRLDWFTAAEMDAAFSAGVAALNKPGEISEPVRSSFGWHVIRLEGRRPSVQKSFEQARDEIMTELRTKYVNDQREAMLAKIRNDPAIRARPEAIDALVIRVDPEAVRRAREQLPPGAMTPPVK